ncbi:uncharacterized protein Tco025E_04268 [Trypanosoma conorhini]|uniref:Uncharacterized protein n=1 Tax=Trypanosoma conorhini TaxID=83891 RepID=A0A3R7L0Z6_9TRYP|nr:uncharacterized protein Tco025E_04268 [Trypanosoma conorhini]RNF18939.1 hypothetical protein Tco025E_04268 [Trypanosoma conorhini]
MDHRSAPPAESPPDHTRLALQPREVKFCDLAPSIGRGAVGTPPKNEKRGFRPTPQKVSHVHAARATKLSITDGLEAESGDEEERRRIRRRGTLDVGVTHMFKARKHKMPRAPQVCLHPEQFKERMEIAGNALWGEDYGVSAVSALEVLENCVTHERRLKEELARAHAAKMLAFRSVISVYLASVKQCGKPILGRRKAGAEVALAQCAVVAQTLVLAIQNYVRAFQSRKHAAVRRHFSRSGLSPDLWSNSTERMPQFKERHPGAESTLSETTTSLHELLDEAEIGRLKQLYFDYYDCDVYVIPGTRPESGIPPNALLLDSLSAHDPFVSDVEEDAMGPASLSTCTTSSME